MSDQKICPTCSTEYPLNERFCPRDGTALRSQGGGTDLVGSILAERYHVIKKLGEGGMGQVYLAEHVKMGRRSAVKVMRTSMINDAEALGRFNREAANASRINHPHVAGIYDFGETSDGLVYLAMEYIEGETLTDLLKANGALPPARAAEITRQTAEALHVAHEMGIVHRDLKPDNIMITKDHDGNDCVKVVDFGIAKAAGSEKQNVTRTGMVVGTPEYMSPEQLAGDALDGRSDMYSLGLVAFNMLTGKLPFPSETTQSSMIMRLTEEPRPLSEMKGDVEWPAELQQVMTRVLRRSSADRYQKTRDFSSAFLAATRQIPTHPAADQGTLVMAPRVSAPSPNGRNGSAPVGRRRGPMIVGGVLVVAMIAAAVVFMKPKEGAVPVTSAPAPVAVVVAPPVQERQATVEPPTAQQTAVSSAAIDSTTPTSLPVPAVMSSADSAALARDLRIAAGHASNEASARKALTEADSLTKRATTAEHRVMIQLIRAQAFGTLGQDSNSCQALRDGVDVAKGTSYESRLTGMLTRCK